MKQYILLLSCALSLLLSACASQMATTEPASAAADLSAQETKKAVMTEAARTEAVTTVPVSAEPDAYILPDVALRPYTEKELESFTKDQLYLARNEIYARHGRKFKSDSLNSYFQSKEWYRGTVEPEQFDENQLNELEKENLELIKRLEKENGKNGRADTDKAPYLDVFKKWEASNQGRTVSERLYDDGSGNVCSTDVSRLILHEDYYEVTNCSVTVDEVYDKNIFKGKTAGDRIVFEGEEADISEIRTDENGLREIDIIYAVQGKHSAELTHDGFIPIKRLREREEGFYSSEDNDICEPKKLLYEGSIYFNKNAEISTGMGKGKRIISGKEYFETIRKNEEQDSPTEGYSRRGGLTEDGSIWLFGNGEFDENGYITSFTETSRNWVG